MEYIMKITKKRALILGIIISLLIVILIIIKHMYIHVKSEDGAWDVYYILNIEDLN